MNYYAKVIKLDDKTTKSKNRALKEALKSPYDYFFLVEDNCKVLNDKIYDIFIETSKNTGIEALMWSGGGPNRDLGFKDDPHINYFSDFAPAFTMFTRNVVEKIGFFDEEMPENTWQMEEYFKRIGDNELATPFGMAPSPKGIEGMLELTRNIDGLKNLAKMDEALTYWQQKDDEFPIDIKRPVPVAKPITEMI